jgi:hypothetical protein
MDGKLLLWEKGAVKCSGGEAHAGSAAAVQPVSSSSSSVNTVPRLVTCGYDKLVKVWEAGRGPRGLAAVCALRGHPAPIITMRAHQALGQ